MSARWWAARAAMTAAVVVLVSVATFALLSALPGDPAVTILGPRATEANIAAVRRDLGLDQPPASRYLQWAGRALQGDLGVSYQTNEPVAASLRQRVPASLELLAAAQLTALALAVPLAAIAALRVGGRLDRAITTVTFLGLAVPNFGVGLLLIGIFVVRLGWFDTFGYVPFTEDPLGNLRGMVLPAATLALPLVAQYTRVLRNDLVVTLGRDHVTQARANGLPLGTILVRHGLRQSLTTLLSVVGLNVPTLLGGAVLIESLFAVPGVGRLLFNAIIGRDYLVAQGAVLVIALAAVATNLAVDVGVRLADPRLRRPAHR
ncbi:MAG: ABC transporter permease [Acidimicrobiales bacterium]